MALACVCIQSGAPTVSIEWTYGNNMFRWDHAKMHDTNQYCVPKHVVVADWTEVAVDESLSV